MTKKIYAFTEQETAVIKTALGALAAVLDHPGPARQNMQALMMMAAPDITDPSRHVDKLLDKGGLDIESVVHILGEKEENLYVIAARNDSLVQTDRITIDPYPVISASDAGAHVMCWLWVPADAVGLGEPE